MAYENETITFEQMPQLILALTKEVSELKEMIKQLVSQKQSEKSPDIWMSRDELREYIPNHPSVSSIHRWTSEGSIPFHRSGKRLCFLKSEIDQWLLEKSKKTKSDIIAEADAFFKDRNRAKSAPWRASLYT